VGNSLNMFFSVFEPHLYDSYCKKKLKIVKKFLRKNETILDVACGNPEQDICTKEFLKYPNYIGIDINPPVKQERIFKVDIRRYKPEKKFDVVLCLDALEHFKNPKVIAKKLVDSTKKKLIIATPVTKYQAFRSFMNVIRFLMGVEFLSGHYWEFFEEELLQMFPEMKLKNKYYLFEPAPIAHHVLEPIKVVRSGIFIFERDKQP
jgi:hypothetical protein